ncbi:MAG: CCA tRNA nucleotidyltransferase [Pirellulales bacterium]|nr:CCA tRNA nucleotidyltransferase [Pirellulales bacterium]
MTLIPAEQRQFALHVVSQLRASGFQALFAGGCVRDMLLGLTPTDYDVATNAQPPQIRQVFGKKRTLEIGAEFGVIAVVGPPSVGIVEVVTFRQDLGYSDGRRPDAVAFCTAEEDALRRDFTINGMFYDPVAETVIDYVGGQEDLHGKVVRAIGDPLARFTEDKLRMLRAVRFTARFGFRLEDATGAAIRQMAPALASVSAERIAAELRKLFVLPRRAQGLELLRSTKLLGTILPEWNLAPSATPAELSVWEQTLGDIGGLSRPSFPLVLAMLVVGMAESAALSHSETLGGVSGSPGARQIGETVLRVGRRWKLSNAEISQTIWLAEQYVTQSLAQASSRPWSRVQPVLIQPHIVELLDWTQTRPRGVSEADLDYCRQKLNLTEGELNPPPLITGQDLIKQGLRPGPTFANLLQTLRNAQLDGQIVTQAEAIKFALQLMARE